MNNPSFKLNDNNSIPAIGFGVFQIPNDGSTYAAVLKALEIGYRHIDTAVAYFNETEVGKAIQDSGISRDDIWITSKIRSIGVSNMTPKIWRKWENSFTTMPAVNQVEFNPYFQQKELRKIMAENNVTLEAWAPLGQGNQELLNEPILKNLAKKYAKNVGQIILRFEYQEGIIVFPKTVHSERMISNLNIFDFALTSDEMDSIRLLDKNKGMHDPDASGTKEMLLNAFDVHADDK